MPTPTYTALATTTLASSASSVTFSSIPASYRDLVLVIGNITATAANTIYIRFNGDTGSNYNWVRATGASSVTSSAVSNNSAGILGGSAAVGLPATSPATSIIQIQDYSSTDKHKCTLSRYGSASQSEVDMAAGRWASTSAITSIEIYIGPSGSYKTGTTFSLYGIEA